LNIVPDATVLITFALVWILALILARVFFKPVGRILAERQARLDQAKAETDQALAAAQEDLRRIEERLKEARAASDAIWDRAESESLKEKSRIIQDLQSETRAQVEKARQDLEREVERLKKELDAQTERLAGDIERRILN
jgi:F-type H+-transporting ATPase subunit b